MVAVCRAERGKPAADISWNHTGSLEKITELNDFFTVESHLELPQGMDTQNLSCSVKHPYWKSEMSVVPTLKKGELASIILIFLGGINIYFFVKLMLIYSLCEYM